MDWFLDLIDWIFYQLKMLKHRPRLFWYRLWIRKDEFHISLSYDADAWLDMNENEREAYSKDLVKRRIAAHERDFVQ